MRVLFVSSVRGFGGGEEWFATAPALLQERGHHVVLAARAGEALAAEGRRRGITVFDVPFGGVLDPRALAMLHDILSGERIDVAVTNLDKETRVLALAALGEGRIALVPRRGSDIPLADVAVNRALWGKRVDRVLVNSTGILATLERSLPALDPAKVVLLPNGVDAVELPAEERLAHEARWPAGEGARVITIGELSARKNQAGIVRALATVPSPWRLLVLGDGAARQAIADEVLRNGVADRVHLAGHVPDARRIAAAADLAVHFSGDEGQPWAVLESLASGVPTIASRLPGVEPLIADGVNGVTVAPGDERGLAEAIGQLLRDPEKARALGDEARRRIARTHSAAQLGDRLERILEAARLERLHGGAKPRALFLDRDGTLTAELGALGDPSKLRLLPGVGAALRLLDRAGWALVVVTNQAAVGRGTLAPSGLRAVHARLRELVRAEGVELAGIFVCPHAPEEGCACRKPRPGLIHDAVRELGLDPRGSWLAGDTAKDVEAAHAAGIRAALVESGWGGAERPGAAANARAGEDAPRAELEARDLLDLAEKLT